MIINGGIYNGGTYRDSLPLPTNGLQLYLDASNPASYSGSGTTWYDISGQGYQATINSGMTYSSNNHGVFNFDGSVNAYGQIGSGFGYDYSAGVTINVWANFTTGIGAWERLIDFGNGPGGADGYNLILCRREDTSEVNTTVDGVNADYLDPGRMSITWDGWAMYTLYADGTYWKQYKNGQYYSFQINSNLPATVTRNLNYIGRSNWEADAYYTGSMSVIQLYNRALSESEIAQCYEYFKGRYGL